MSKHMRRFAPNHKGDSNPQSRTSLAWIESPAPKTANALPVGPPLPLGSYGPSRSPMPHGVPQALPEGVLAQLQCSSRWAQSAGELPGVLRHQSEGPPPIHAWKIGNPDSS